MTIEQIRSKIIQQEYAFLRDNPRLGKNIILLGLGGSHAYGTETEGSDLDVRGCAVHSPQEILTASGFEQVVDVPTDTTIYSLRKMIWLLGECNPNMIEILGLKPEHYLILTDEGKMLLDNKHLFLSKIAIAKFGGYVNEQLQRMKNKSSRTMDQEGLESHILERLQSAAKAFPERYAQIPDDGLKLYVGESQKEDMDTEIFLDIRLSHYPLRDCKDIIRDMHDIVKAYAKIGKRNKNAFDHGKIEKHMMHLIRLYLTGFDLLEKGEIITHREKDLGLLMDIRNGGFLDADRQPTKEFFKMVDDYEARFKRIAESTKLPDKPDYDGIHRLFAKINRIVLEKAE